MSAKGWDYVVIGAGAAGCVVAGRLSQMLPEARIVLIEGGRKRLGVTTRVPGIAFIASTFPRQNWNYQTEPVPALNGRRLLWFQGRILGGSSSINGMLDLRGHSLEYDQWAQRGCQGWSFDQVLPYFKKAETNSRGAPLFLCYARRGQALGHNPLDRFDRPFHLFKDLGLDNSNRRGDAGVFRAPVGTMIRSYRAAGSSQSGPMRCRVSCIANTISPPGSAFVICGGGRPAVLKTLQHPYMVVDPSAKLLLLKE